MDKETARLTLHRTTLERSRAAKTTWSRSSRKRSFQRLETERIEPVSREFTASGAGWLPPRRDRALARLAASEIQDVDCPGRTLPEIPNREPLELTHITPSDPHLHLSHPCYGLPQKLIDNFASMGIHSIYPWQCRCLTEPGLLNGQRNLVYTAPTGGGKSLVADVLMLKAVIENPNRKALLVLPYVALVQEKLRWLRRAVDAIRRHSSSSIDRKWTTTWRPEVDEGQIRVVGFFGGSRTKATWNDTDVAICTMEKVCNVLHDDRCRER